MTIGPRPVCLDCKHIHPEDPVEDGFFCDAFPEGIPFEMIANLFVHDKPYPGDNGIQFEPMEVPSD